MNIIRGASLGQGIDEVPRRAILSIAPLCSEFRDENGIVPEQSSTAPETTTPDSSVLSANASTSSSKRTDIPNGQKTTKKKGKNVPINDESQKEKKAAKEFRKISKAFAYKMRHAHDKSEFANKYKMHDNYFYKVDDLIKAMKADNMTIDRSMIAKIVNDDDKQRFSCLKAGAPLQATKLELLYHVETEMKGIEYIRANNGHNLSEVLVNCVDTTQKGISTDQYKELLGERYIIHGTSRKSLKDIINFKNINAMNRRDVHFTRTLCEDDVKMIKKNIKDNPIIVYGAHIPSDKKLSGIRDTAECLIVIDLAKLLEAEKRDEEKLRWWITFNGVVSYTGAVLNVNADAGLKTEGVSTKHIEGVIDLKENKWIPYKDGEAI